MKSTRGAALREAVGNASTSSAQYGVSRFAACAPARTTRSWCRGGPSFSLSMPLGIASRHSPSSILGQRNSSPNRPRRRFPAGAEAHQRRSQRPSFPPSERSAAGLASLVPCYGVVDARVERPLRLVTALHALEAHALHGVEVEAVRRLDEVCETVGGGSGTRAREQHPAEVINGDAAFLPLTQGASETPRSAATLRRSSSGHGLRARRGRPPARSGATRSSLPSSTSTARLVGQPSCPHAICTVMFGRISVPRSIWPSNRFPPS